MAGLGEGQTVVGEVLSRLHRYAETGMTAQTEVHGLTLFIFNYVINLDAASVQFIMNLNNGNRRTYSATAGSIEILFSQEDILFQGDITVEVYAIDRVGNQNTVNCIIESFAVTAYAERLLTPHEPVFRCGESGRLVITSYEYVDKVEVIFPKELTDIDPGLNTTYSYDGTIYRKEEEYEFMVPLGTPLGEYTIVINAWKDGEQKSCYPIIWTLGEEESVLNDIRTRLR